MAARIETGVMQPVADWPGIFIRGDDALAYARQLRSLLAAFEKRAEAGDITDEEILPCSRLNELADLLEACRASGTEQRKNRVSESRQNHRGKV